MMLSTQLQTDLRELSVEARKKFPDIKESAEHAILKLRSISEQYKETSQQLQELTKNNNEVLRPFLLACETKQNKLLGIALSGIHKLITHGALAPTSISTTVRTISAQMGLILNEESAQLKVLQTMVALLGMRTFTLHSDDLSQALSVCFRLLVYAHGKSPTCSLFQPVSASLRQIVGTLLDRTHHLSLKHSQLSLLSVDERETVTMELASSLMDVHKLFKDLCNLTAGEPAIWLSVDNLPRTFGLELLEEALTHHAALFRSVPELQTLLKDKLCKLLIKYFRVTEDFAYLVRLLRIVTAFVIHFYDLFIDETEALLMRLLSLFESAAEAHNDWIQTLVLEVILQFNQVPTLLCGLYQQYDARGTTKIFEKMTATLGKVVQRMFDWNEDEFMFQSGPLAISSASKFRSMLTDATWLHRNEATPPPITRSYLVSLCTNAIHALIDSIALLIANMYKELHHTTHTLPLNIQPLPSESHPRIPVQIEDEFPALDTAEFKMCQTLAQTVWTCVLASLSLMLDKSKDEAVVQNILKAYQSFTNTCSVLRLSTPREALLTSLCKQALPYNKKNGSLRGDERSASFLEFVGSTRLSKKHIQAMKTLLNIAHGMGSYLEESWYIVLGTFERLHIILSFTNKTAAAANISLSGTYSENEGRQKVENEEGDDDSWVLAEEITILRSALDSLFTTSQYISRAGIVTLLTQLSRLSAQSVTRLNEETPEIDVHKYSLFGLMKMSTVILCNAHRVELLWPIFHAHIGELLQHRNAHLRVYAVKLLVSTIQEVIVRLLKGQSSSAVSEAEEQSIPLSPSPSSLLPQSQHALSVWRVISQLVNALPPIAQSPHSAVRVALSEAVLTLLQTTGGLLHHGTSCVFGSEMQDTHLSLCSLRTNFVKRLLAYSTNNEKFVEMLLSSLSVLDKSTGTVDMLPTTVSSSSVPHDNNKENVGITDDGAIAALNSEVWVTLLRVVQVPAQTRDSAVVPIAFKVLSLVCTEYLPLLPIDTLPFLIATIGHYVEGSVDTQSALMLTTVPQQLLQHQQSLALRSSRQTKDVVISQDKPVDSLGTSPSKTFDINVSFPAIGLLWDIADYLAKDLYRVVSQLQPSVYSLTAHVLWMVLLQEITRHASSSHSDIRTCALHTLYGIVATHGGSMPRFHRLATLASLIHLLLFPMMNTIIALAKHAHLNSSPTVDPSSSSSSPSATTAVTISATNASITGDAPISPSTSSPVLMMHHSRNTVAKQWHETLVIALSGLVRIFKTHFDLLVEFVHGDFTSMWKMLLMYIDIFAHSDATEVVTAAITALREVLLTRATRRCVDFSSKSVSSLSSFQGNVYPSALWVSAWSLFARVLYRALRTKKEVAKILHAYHESLKELYAKLHPQFTPLDVHRFLTLTAAVPLVALHTDAELTAIHRHTIDLVERIVCDIYKRVLVQLPQDKTAFFCLPDYHLCNVAHAVALLLHFVAASIGYPYRAHCDSITHTERGENVTLLQCLDSVFGVDTTEDEFVLDPLDLRDFLTPPFASVSSSSSPRSAPTILSITTSTVSPRQEASGTTASSNCDGGSDNNNASSSDNSHRTTDSDDMTDSSGVTSLRVQHVARLTVDFENAVSPLTYAAHKTWNPQAQSTLIKWFPLAERAIKGLRRVWDLFMFGHVFVKRDGETDPVTDPTPLAQPPISSLECLSVVTWIFPDLCLVLGRAMQMKSIHYNHDLWQLAVDTFTHVVRTGLLHTLFRAKNTTAPSLIASSINNDNKSALNTAPNSDAVDDTNNSSSQRHPPAPAAELHLLPSVNLMDMTLILTDIADSIEAFLFEEAPRSATSSTLLTASSDHLSGTSDTRTTTTSTSQQQSLFDNVPSGAMSLVPSEPPRAPPPRRSLFSNHVTRDSEFEIQLVGLITEALLPATHFLYSVEVSSDSPPSSPILLISSQQYHMLIMRLLMLLFDGSNQQNLTSDRNREQFVCVCYEHLFGLLSSTVSPSTRVSSSPFPVTTTMSSLLSSTSPSSSASSYSTVSFPPSSVPPLQLPPIAPTAILWTTRIVLRELMKRCKEVLRQFVLDDRQMGNLPLPRARLVEVNFLLSQLKNLQLKDAEALWDTPNKMRLSPSRRHLWELYPEFCDCITVREQEIKEQLKEIFHLTAKELGLE